MFLSSIGESIGLLRPYGFLLSNASLGGSVANDSEPNVSITKFTHNIWTALSGTDLNEYEIKWLKLSITGIKKN